MLGDGKKKNKTRKAVTQPELLPPKIAQDVQQHCLSVFKDALWTSVDDLNTVQEVKGHLYNRDFARAFGKPEYLRAYALRWSASRALAYAAIFDDVAAFVRDSEIKVVSLGGGAGAELVGLAGWMSTQTAITAVSVRAVDIAEWSGVIDQLHQSIVTPVKLSEYASVAAKERNKALLPEGLTTNFFKADVLQWTEDDVRACLSGAALTTLMFTLNELYSTSLPATQKFLHAITATTEKDSLLLVVDSPGSYSTVTINGSEKKYPMQWLLDHTLLGKDEDTAPWIKLFSDDSQWFRLPDGLQYPVDLENMRYQIHLYQRRQASV